MITIYGNGIPPIYYLSLVTSLNSYEIFLNFGGRGGDLGKQKLFDPSPSQTHFFPNCEKTETNKQVIQSKESECNPHSMSDKICITTSFGILKYFQVSI